MTDLLLSAIALATALNSLSLVLLWRAHRALEERILDDSIRLALMRDDGK